MSVAKRIWIVAMVLIYQQRTAAQYFPMANHPNEKRWADSIVKKLSLRQQIGQMMMVAAWSNKGADHVNDVEKLILQYGIGGLCFFQGHPLKQAYQTNYYQQISDIPLLVSIDGEWGLAMRHKMLDKFPFQMTLGATGDEQLVHETGRRMGLQCKRMGIHINFSPVADINTNASNPIIGFRSFGESPELVSRYATLMSNGMQESGIIACAKHFPGHGDSESDSHTSLPTISADLPRLNEIELKPFKQLITAGVGSIMIGHLAVPALDTARNTPASLSKPIVTDLLKRTLNYQGLIITDALNMKGVSAIYGPGYVEAKAALAGNDILLFPENVPKAIDLIEAMVKSGEIDSAELSMRVHKILYFKALSGLARYQPIVTANLMQDLNNTLTSAEEAITVSQDKYSWLPLTPNTKVKTAWLAIGKNSTYPFEAALSKHHLITPYYLHRDSSNTFLNRILDSAMCRHERIIISIHDQPLWGKNRNELPEPVLQLIKTASLSNQTMIVVFGSPYLLAKIDFVPCSIVAYEDGKDYQERAANMIFGRTPASGHLPVGINNGMAAGFGIQTAANIPNYKAVSPLKLGFSQNFSPSLDSLLSHYVSQKAMPGGQLMVMKDGQIAYLRAYGRFEYDSSKTVQLTDLYDIASITKAAATTLCVMKLYETKQIKLDAHLHTYLPELNKTNKAKLTIRQLLTHSSGLQPFIPFYKNALNVQGLFAPKQDTIHQVQVAADLWMRGSYRDTIWQQIMQSELKKKGEFVYSDLGFILLGKIVERLSGMRVDQYAQTYFYEPMRLKRTLFNPSRKFYNNEIAPSAYDGYFRHQKIQGFVHDPAAAMLGGVAGHAGLFSNAHELGKIMQMLNNGGTLDGKQYFKQETVALFVTAQKGTHRGLGFDKPNGLTQGKANVSEMVPPLLFGHSGFTGNWAWADPKNDLIFIFLSNRTYPDEANKKLIQENVRTKAIEIVYKALRP